MDRQRSLKFSVEIEVLNKQWSHECCADVVRKFVPATMRVKYQLYKEYEIKECSWAQFVAVIAKKISYTCPAESSLDPRKLDIARRCQHMCDKSVHPGVRGLYGGNDVDPFPFDFITYEKVTRCWLALQENALQKPLFIDNITVDILFENVKHPRSLQLPRSLPSPRH